MLLGIFSCYLFAFWIMALILFLQPTCTSNEWTHKQNLNFRTENKFKSHLAIIKNKDYEHTIVEGNQLTKESICLSWWLLQAINFFRPSLYRQTETGNNDHPLLNVRKIHQTGLFIHVYMVLTYVCMVWFCFVIILRKFDSLIFWINDIIC
jgi:hypothetical protein